MFLLAVRLHLLYAIKLDDTDDDKTLKMAFLLLIHIYGV